MLQTQIVEFKKTVRKIKKFTVPLKQEWQLERCKVMRNRLCKAAINNRQAAIRGSPFVTQEDAEKIMRT